MTEYAWVIEHAHSEASRPCYWTGGYWTERHEEACRYCRREDAERTLTGIRRFEAMEGLERMPHRVAEHGWDT